MNGIILIWGIVLAEGFLCSIQLLRCIAKHFDLPEAPKDFWIIFSFNLGMVFLKTFQKFCMKDNLDRKNDKDNQSESNYYIGKKTQF